jgi:nucleotide-binding universal stress UspA family protein
MNQPARFRSLLVPIDLTPSSDRVLGRLPLLPLARDARVTILHVVPKGLPPALRRRALRDANKALAEEVRHVRRSLPRDVTIQSLTRVGIVPQEISACAKKVKAELIVMGRGGRRSFREAFLGSTAERVIRRSQRPVLVVRLPARAAYRRPALALDLDEATPEIVRLLLLVLPPPRPRVTIIHAFDFPYGGATYPSLSHADAEETRKELQVNATVKLASLVGVALARENAPPRDAPSWESYVRYGSPRTVVEKAIRKNATDLLLLGTRGYSGATYVWLGSVAGDLLRQVKCDVLVVPPDPPPKVR